MEEDGRDLFHPAETIFRESIKGTTDRPEFFRFRMTTNEGFICRSFLVVTSSYFASF